MPNWPDLADLRDLPDLPTGTVTFLFTDIEGSTKLLAAHASAYGQALVRHHDLRWRSARCGGPARRRRGCGSPAWSAGGAGCTRSQCSGRWRYGPQRELTSR